MNDDLSPIGARVSVVILIANGMLVFGVRQLRIAELRNAQLKGGSSIRSEDSGAPAALITTTSANQPTKKNLEKSKIKRRKKTKKKERERKRKKGIGKLK